MEELEGRPGTAESEAGIEGASVALFEPTSIDFAKLLTKGRRRAMFAMLGPAFVASVAYVDPGNFATNFSGGARFGYMLLWVVLLANLMAVFVQYLSAKLGIVTNRNLPELYRENYPRSSWAMWIQAEVVAMATDVAEFIGAALGLNLLFGVPLPWAGVITGFVAFAVLEMQTHGFRRFELAITAFLSLVLLGFLYETLKVGPSAHESLRGLIPHLHGSDSLYIAVGIVGATVMPHAIFLHSALTAKRVAHHSEAEKKSILGFELFDTTIALGLAGLVNLAMLAVAAKLFYHGGAGYAMTVQHAYHGISRQVGGVAALMFAVALLASGLASSSVGTYAGQVVMSGFTKLSIPLVLRRAVTMLPALILLVVNYNPTEALILSQVVLSFGIPLAIIPLVLFTSKKKLMGTHVNRVYVTVIGWTIAVVITLMNAFLIYQQLV